MGKLSAIRAELAGWGVEGWADPKFIGTARFVWVPLANLNGSHAEGLAQRFREREAARRRGAAPCRHPCELVGACPLCRGLWPDPPVYEPPPLTRAAFDAIVRRSARESVRMIQTERTGTT